LLARLLEVVAAERVGATSAIIQKLLYMAPFPVAERSV
jgi:hypothetical protein